MNAEFRDPTKTAQAAYEHALEGFCQDPGPTPEQYEFEPETEEEHARVPSGTHAR